MYSFVNTLKVLPCLCAWCPSFRPIPCGFNTGGQRRRRYETVGKPLKAISRATFYLKWDPILYLCTLFPYILRRNFNTYRRCRRRNYLFLGHGHFARGLPGIQFKPARAGQVMYHRLRLVILGPSSRVT